MKTLDVTPAVDVFANVIPITIVSIAVELDDGTVYTAVAEAPADVFTLAFVYLLKSFGAP